MMTNGRRLTLRDLDVPQKLLVFVIVATIGLGYIGALVNVFAQVAGADGQQSVRLENFLSLYREKGLVTLLREIQASLGMNDVVKTYHGSGVGVTRLEAALEGTMREKIAEYYGVDATSDDATKQQAESDRLALIAWSHLPQAGRKRAFEEGVPVDAAGAADREAMQRWLGAEAAEATGDPPELAPVIAETFTNACVTCHSKGGPDAQARMMPLETFKEIDHYCAEDHGMSMRQLALTTHVHLLGFSVLFALTGFLFSLTSYSTLIRAIFAPWALFFQVLEIACWWLAKSNILFAQAIFYLGPLVGIGLGIQLLGVLIDLVMRRGAEE